MWIDGNTPPRTILDSYPIPSIPPKNVCKSEFVTGFMNTKSNSVRISVFGVLISVILTIQVRILLPIR